jgi:H+-transporting ATPase
MEESLDREKGQEASSPPAENKSPQSVTPAATGLSESEANRRLAEYGYNEIIEKEQSTARKFLGYFWGPIPWMIEAAMILSAAVGDFTDFTIILILLLTNAGVGFWEEYNAGNAIAALKKKLALNARVKRDGKWASIPARELVPGDLIRVRLGDIVPADATLLECEPLEVDQSALTGESLPVSHKSGEGVYSGSVIRMGEADAVVTETGKDTYFGRTAHLVEKTRITSHFQKAVLKIGDYLIIIALVLVALILTVALFRHDSILETLRFALVLTVAAIPVAMPTVLSVTMAVGARLLSVKQAIVSRLAAIEEMAGIDILCSDKTGTLTQNRLKLGEPFAVEGVSIDEVVLMGSLASRAEDQDAIDQAVLAGLKKPETASVYSVEHFRPFDPVNKRTEATVIAPDSQTFKATKGAVQVILSLSANAAAVQPEVDKVVDGFAARGFRSLGVARTDRNGDWQFIGVLPLFDPPREDSKSTIDTAEKMGVDVKMVTGDQLAIAKEISRQLGMGNDITDAALFSKVEHHMSRRLEEQIEHADGFAQVFPEHKYHIVEVLQDRGHIVGMTGDGVNDAPALKKADAGIAVSGSTDAARAAADLVLLTPGLSVIIDAIKESRKIFQRMTSYSIYRIAETIRVLLFMTLSILVFNFYPVTAVMIVLLALLNDGAILSIAYDRVRGSDHPEKWNMKLVLGLATVLGIAGVIASFGIFYIFEKLFPLYLKIHVSREMIQTLIYLKLSVAGHLTIFITRTRGPFWSSRPSLILLVAVIFTQILATFIAVYGLLMPPIGWDYAAFIWVYAFLWFLVNDRIKLLAYRVFESDHTGWLAKW